MPEANTNGSANGFAGFNEQTFRRFEELVYNALTFRSEFLQSFADPRRNYNRECGYPEGLFTAWNYQDLYDKEPVAARVVSILPEECWKVSPSVYEDEDSEVTTPFEEAWDALGKMLKSEPSWYEEESGSAVWEYLKRADEQSGIGYYGVILLGLDDGRDLREPAQSRENQKLLFLRVFPHSLSDVVRMESDRSSPRYGMPLEYQLTFNDPKTSLGSVVGATTETQNVHWSRVVHIADNLSSSEIFGIPRMQQVLRRILNVEKVSAGAGEGYWKGAFPGISFESHPNADVDVTITPATARRELEQYMNGLQRYLVSTGMAAKTLPPNVLDPTPFINAEIDQICIKLGVPKRIFLGSERGELSSSQDEGAWNDRIRGRHNNYLTPKVIVPFVNRLISLGVLPEPGSFKVFWPDVAKVSDAEKATVAATKTQALAAYVAGSVESIIPPIDYLTRVMGMEEEEANAILESAAKEVETSLERREMFGIQPTQPQEEPDEVEEEDEEDSEQEPVANELASLPEPPKRYKKVIRHFREEGGGFRSEITEEEY